MNHSPSYQIDKNFIRSPIDFGEMSLVQVGRRFCGRDGAILAHTHLSWFELTVAVSGEADVRTNDTVTHISRGEIHLSLPYEIHEIQPRESGFEFDFFAFIPNDEKISARFEEIMNLAATGGNRKFRDERIESLVRMAIYEYSDESAKDPAVLKNLFSLLTAYLIRDFEKIDKEHAPTSSADIICFKIMNYIDTHISTISGLEEVARVFGYSYNYLSTLFKRTTGKTVSDYYLSRRMELARVMVLEKEKKICEIAEALNYSTPFAFTKAFTARYGISPKKMQTLK